MPLNGLKNCWNEYPRQCAVPSTGVLLSRENRIHFLSCVYIEDITRWREDLNFMFEWQEQYLTSEQSERMRYCSCHENIKFISSRQRVMFFHYMEKPIQQKQKARIETSLNDSTLTRHKGDIWKIRHSGPGLSGVWNLRVVKFPVKHSPPYNKDKYVVQKFGIFFRSITWL